MKSIAILRQVYSRIAQSAFMAAFLLGCLLAATALSAGEKDGRLDIYWVDTEGGAATLIVTPQGESVLIDTGNPGRRDPGRITQAAAQVAGIKQIDHLIITHYHGDHFGGAATLATMLPIKNLYDNGLFDGMPNQPDKSYLELKCDKRNVLQPGDRLELNQGDKKQALGLICLGTRQQFVQPEAVQAKPNEEIIKLHTPKDRDGSDNANSVVMLLSFGDFRSFDAGDLTWNQELKLVHPYNLVGDVDVYQVTHHGLDSSNNPVVLQTLKPTVAVMNNGHEKGCLPEVFANLSETKSLQAIYQVHKNLRPDGSKNNVPDEFIANHKAADDCDGHYIKLSVDPSAKTYTIEIPANKHAKTYETTEKK